MAILSVTFRSLFLIVLLTATACQPDRHTKYSGRAKALAKPKTKNLVQAKEKIEDSFKVEPKNPDARKDLVATSLGNDQKTATAAPSGEMVKRLNVDPQHSTPAPSNSPLNATTAPGKNSGPSQESYITPSVFSHSENAKPTTTTPMNANGALISIAREALDKEFLLQGVLIPQDKIAIGKSIKSRIVAFQLRGSLLVMLEATQGHSVSTEFPQSLVLATFPIIHQDSEFISFDFNIGMSKFLSSQDWFQRDDKDSVYSTENQFATFNLINTFIDQARITDTNILEIRQVGSMINNEITANKAQVQIPVELKYYLSPYVTSNDFQPSEAPLNFNHFGFFEVHPQLNTNGKAAIYAARFDEKKTITFAISKNTPSEYKKAIEEGILYWNKAFEKTVVAFIDAPEGVRAPDSKYNVVQWVNWDYAGSAYADSQKDPRTGEILHAHIYLSSTFAFSSKNRIHKLLRQFSENQDQTPTGDHWHSLKLINQGGLCNFDLGRSLVNTFENVNLQNLSAETILKFSRDEIRAVVAHEVGHTLGLRHNFAGSLAANYNSSERPGIFKQYLQKGHVDPGLIYSSSIMDYFQAEETVMIGDSIVNSSAALKHDTAAIQKLYFNIEPKSLGDLPLFCTDSPPKKPTFMDCKKFDFGHSPIEFAKYEITEALQSLPRNLIDIYIRNKTDPEFTKVFNASEVTLKPTDQMAEEIFKPLGEITKLMTSERALLQIERTFTVADDRVSDQLQTAYMNYLASEINRQNGWNEILNLLPSDFAEKAITELKALLQKDSYKTGVGARETAFTFSDEELKQIETDLTVYIRKLEKSLILAELRVLKNANANKDSNAKYYKFVDSDSSKAYAKALAHKIWTILHSSNDLPIKTEIVIAKANDPGEEYHKPIEYENVTVNLPTFIYPFEIRLLASSLLDSDQAEDRLWGLTEQLGLEKSYKKWLDDTLGFPFESLELIRQNPVVQRWIVENKSIISTLK